MPSPRTDLPPDAEPHRAEVQRWLDETAPGGRWPSDFSQRLAEAGYAAPHWPRPWGLDAGPVQQLAIDAALRAARAPRTFNPIGIGWAGPTLMVAGSPEQQERWIPGILDGSELWCQLFSEPGAGSDLASLTTRATRATSPEGRDEWVVNGQKVWTTFAHLARWGILLTRTDPDATDQAGISYFVVDMRSEGIETAPIKQMDGNADFNEVFLTDVRVPAANLVGTERDGWRLAKVTLGNERVSLSGEGALWGQGPTAHDLLDLVRANGGVRDPVLRQRLADLYVEAEVLRLIRLRTLSARVRGLEPGPEASVRKALADEHGQHVMSAALDLAGTGALLTDHGPFGADTALWADGYLYSRALTIGGGTSEVQRNIIGERVLGLPREPEPGDRARDHGVTRGVSVRIPQNAGLLEWLAEQADPAPRRIRARRRVAEDKLRCDPDLVDRLESSATGLPGARLRYLVGFPVLIHPNEVVFGIAAGTTWLAYRLPQLGQRAVVPSQWGRRGLAPEWVDVDPWLSDLPIPEGTSRVRGWSRAAYAHAAELGSGTLGGPRPRPMRRRPA